MIRRVCMAVAASRAHPVIVVLGHQADRVLAAIDDLDVVPIRNLAFGDGMSTSVRAGLTAVEERSEPIDGAMFVLGDMPRIEARHIDAIIDGFEPAADRDVCAPTYSGRRGNPVLWSASYFAELQTLRGDRGARTLLERYSDRVRLIELDASVTFDVDVPDDLP